MLGFSSRAVQELQMLGFGVQKLQMLGFAVQKLQMLGFAVQKLQMLGFAVAISRRSIGAARHVAGRWQQQPPCCLAPSGARPPIITTPPVPWQAQTSPTATCSVPMMIHH